MNTHRISEEGVYAVFTNRTGSGGKVRPSNWPERLADIVEAHWRGRRGPRCGGCYYCADRYCFVMSAEMFESETSLVADLGLVLRTIGATPLQGGCPKYALANAEALAANAGGEYDAA